MLREVIQKIVSCLPAVKNEPFKENELANFIRTDFQECIKKIVNTGKIEYTIKASAGAGNWADVFWLSILDNRITNTTQAGIYPVFLFCADGSGVFLSLNQGTTKPAIELGKSKSAEIAQKNKEICIKNLALLPDWNHGIIDLKASTALGISYQAPNIAAKFYRSNEIPKEETLLADISELISAYQKISEAWMAGYFHENKSLSTKENTSGDCDMPFELSKPFMLLAGISGTGKTRFVRNQAKMAGTPCCLVPVRPDWHEPSDLLGYVSRLGSEGPRYVCTDVLRFMAKAWTDASAGADTDGITVRDAADMKPHWLCLDEMNLAPVEQYFADYLSVLETREWDEDGYRCEPLLAAGAIAVLDAAGREALRADLGLEGPAHDGLWDCFLRNGIGLPPNLIVAGTVNMDETTHGFSRKVIDRAVTLDFGGFFPNDFGGFFSPSVQVRTFTFPRSHQAKREDFASVAADRDAALSIAFLEKVNEALRDTPFELAYRALNGLLLAVAQAAPEDEQSLQAVWDDFLMTRVLPRIEGDREKLSLPDGQTVLESLSGILSGQLASIKESTRPDLFRTDMAGNPVRIPCRCNRKLTWMQARLDNNGFTSFWP